MNGQKVKRIIADTYVIYSSLPIAVKIEFMYKCLLIQYEKEEPHTGTHKCLIINYQFENLIKFC